MKPKVYPVRLSDVYILVRDQCVMQVVRNLAPKRPRDKATTPLCVFELVKVARVYAIKISVFQTPFINMNAKLYLCQICFISIVSIYGSIQSTIVFKNINSTVHNIILYIRDIILKYYCFKVKDLFLY